MIKDDIKIEFINIFNKHIIRDGSKSLLDYLEKSDFFTAPASMKYHLPIEGGLCQHSINVYKRLVTLVKTELGEDYTKKISDESLAIMGLLHDVCKIGCYHKEIRNVKKDGKWNEVEVYGFKDNLPYGHGEKSVYILSGFLRLTREEAMAINWHMGGYDARAQQFSGSMLYEAYTQFPIAFLLHIADNMASYLDENE